MNNDQSVQLTDGSSVPEDGSHTSLKENGQQEGYVVLSPEERAKGFVRPYRDSYVHAGKKLRGNLEKLSPPGYFSEATEKRYAAIDRFELSDGSKAGTYLTQEEVNQIEESGHYGGCNGLTTMNRAIAETYARDPNFYTGTFCVHCQQHFPLDQFVWDGTDEQVGS